ncbi:MAG: HI0074 family nucleotidyltransferase substrate-binding subunit [Anaerolineales bacterium]|nr:HI0074 family nucleotidyltransferase substrate-binding subunit [Anaerolineales bacterium]
MERVKERLKVARKALTTLQELADKPNFTVLERDAAIQRFEYTFEASWRAVQTFLYELEGVVANSPKSAVRASWQAGLLDEVSSQAALRMCEARNMTVHTYNEKLAQEIADQVPGFARLLDEWLSAMEKRFT